MCASDFHPCLTRMRLSMTWASSAALGPRLNRLLHRLDAFLGSKTWRRNARWISGRPSFGTYFVVTQERTDVVQLVAI
jgi:hypothetical protein